MNLVHFDWYNKIFIKNRVIYYCGVLSMTDLTLSAVLLVL